MSGKKLENYAFIDGQNLNLSIRELGWKIDWRKLRIYLKEKYHVKKAYYFIGYMDTNSLLYQSLQEVGYILVFKPTLKDKDGKVKGNCDTELVLHSMIEYPNYKKAVIVAGDGDYHCLIEYLAKKHKLFKLLVPNKYKYSALLRKFMPFINFMNSLRKKLEYKKERH